MTLFICNSPFHVINAINYVCNSKQCISDIVLINMFNGASEIADNLGRTQLFRKLFYFDNDCNSEGFETKIKTLFCPENVIRKEQPLILEEQYNEVIVPTYMSMIARALCTYFSENGAKMSYIEEGTGTYAYGLPRFDKLEMLASNLFGKGIASQTVDRLLMYNPNMMLVDCEIKYEALAQMQRNDETIKKVNDIFSTEGDLQFAERYIFIFESDIYGVTFDMQMNVLLDLVKVVGKENVVIKPHPKTDISQLCEYKLLRGNVPWEVYCINNDMSKKTIVVMNSTAAFTPSMILGDTPTIVFANDYPIIVESEFTKSCIIMQKKFVEQYNNSSVFRVNKLDDFRTLCNK